ncbi:hypothetical protein [Paenibacillus pinihumi]|uniref:hypothetical protein n=1 Tax=Paenibacillus pinihumi TaxID=669462 RepID=UPI001FE07ACA|nr:hypothetical protein [Paenibacillus pinihumi]
MEEMYAEDGAFWVDDSSTEEDKRTGEELAMLCDWKVNPLAALPQWLSIAAIK